MTQTHAFGRLRTGAALAVTAALVAWFGISAAGGQESDNPPADSPRVDPPAVEIRKPKLFLVGDSIMQTGRGDGAQGP
jgi:hypothetical protein